MTYNIHHCNPPFAGSNNDVEAIARVITAEKPDFVALQEVDVNTERSGIGLNQAKELARLTGMNFFFSKAIDHQGAIMALPFCPVSPSSTPPALSCPSTPPLGAKPER